MAFRLEIADLADFVVPAFASHPNEPSVWPTRFETPKGDMSFEEMPVRDGLTILQGRYDWKDDIQLTGSGDAPLLEMHFNLSPESIYYKNKIAASDIVAPMSGNITFLTADDNQARIGFKNNVVYKTFDIHLPPSLLSQYEGESKRMDSFLYNIDQNKSAVLSKSNISVDTKMMAVIEDIMACPYAGLTRRMYLESKAGELIALSYYNIGSNPLAQQLPVQDLERIHFAAQLIRENIDHPFTIVELAAHVGVNQTKLKQGFRTVLNNTVFGYLQHIRMEKARQYLLDTDLPIQEISLRSGYQSVSNFSIAFKKIFHCSPTTLRKKM